MVDAVAILARCQEKARRWRRLAGWSFALLVLITGLAGVQCWATWRARARAEDARQGLDAAESKAVLLLHLTEMHGRELNRAREVCHEIEKHYYLMQVRELGLLLQSAKYEEQIKRLKAERRCAAGYSDPAVWMPKAYED